VLEDQAGYYLLGYHHPKVRAGKNKRSDFHRIQVKVTARRLHVRSRSGFLARRTISRFEVQHTCRTIARRHASPFRSSVGMRLTALYTEVPKHVVRWSATL